MTICSLRQIKKVQTRLLLAKLILGFILLPTLLLNTINAHADSEEKVWQALQQQGHVALLRHALAPGTGDPENFSLGDCSTQRNLSETGKTQARNIGSLLRNNGVKQALVYSSQWCRCMETARLLGFGSAQELPVLNSFFTAFEKQQPQTEALRDWIIKQPLESPTILVTHQVNITALTGVFPASGELIVLKFANWQPEIVGRITTSF